VEDKYMILKGIQFILILGTIRTRSSAISSSADRHVELQI
jgi:hypothetical protein